MKSCLKQFVKFILSKLISFYVLTYEKAWRLDENNPIRQLLWGASEKYLCYNIYRHWKKSCLMPDLFRYNDVLRELNILGWVVVFPVHFWFSTGLPCSKKQWLGDDVVGRD